LKVFWTNGAEGTAGSQRQRLRFGRVSALLIGGWVQCSHAASGVLFDGLLEIGAGDRCHGKLLVTEKVIEWRTPFGHCKSAYELMSKTASGQDQHMAFRLTTTGKGCRYSVPTLEHQHAYPDYWTASWYLSSERLRQEDEAFVCPVVRFDR
jgi:hypothetical protein